MSPLECLTRSGQDSEFWHLCFENVQNLDEAEQKCQNFNQSLAKVENTPTNKNSSWYSWFNEKALKKDQIDEISQIFDTTLKNLIIMNVDRIEDLKSYFNIVPDNFIFSSEATNLTNSKSSYLFDQIKIKMDDFRKRSISDLNYIQQNYEKKISHSLNQIKYSFLKMISNSKDKEDITNELIIIQSLNKNLIENLISYVTDLDDNINIDSYSTIQLNNVLTKEFKNNINYWICLAKDNKRFDEDLKIKRLKNILEHSIK